MNEFKNICDIVNKDLTAQKRKRKPLIERFLNSFTTSENDCWEWKKISSSNGYGVFYVNNIGILAHRFSYTFYKGEIPKGMDILHKCDNRKCVNPSHLLAGTHYDNMHDAINKNKIPHEKGEKHAKAKLSEKDVHEIRRLLGEGMNQTAIGRLYNVHRETIRCIRIGRNWSHV